MPDPTLALQKAIRTRLVETAAVTALVPATSILDTNQRPAPSPSIMLGEDQMVDPNLLISRTAVRIFSTLHIWKKEISLAGVKEIAGAVRAAINRGHLTIDASFQVCDCVVSGLRFLRDPDGETSHGIVTVDTLLREVAT